MRGYFGIGVEGISKPMNLGNLLRANTVTNISDARYRNAVGGLDMLFRYHQA